MRSSNTQIEEIEENATRTVRKKALFASLVFVAAVALVSIPLFTHHLATVSAAPKTALVTVTASGFSPETISVTAGTSVSWDNEDTSPHVVASDPYPTDNGLPGFNSINALQTGDSYSYDFTKVGTFTYHDQLNPYALMGTVIVTK
jgi:plastocyanin